MRLKKPLLLLLLLVLAAAAADLNARKALRTGAQALRGRNTIYGKRLCIHNLIRIVSFLCGASRWKRLSENRGAEKPSRGSGASLEFVQSNSDRATEDIKQRSASDPEQEQLQHTGQPTRQQPLKRLFNFYGDYNACVPTSDNLSEYIGQTENAVWQRRGGPGLAKLRKSNNFPQVNSPHRKRYSSVEVAERCCKVGCTKTDFSRLC